MTKQDWVMRLIRAGKTRLVELTAAAPTHQADGAAVFNFDRRLREREIDRCLQKLRRAGKVTYNRQDGWRLVKDWKP